MKVCVVHFARAGDREHPERMQMFFRHTLLCRSCRRPPHSSLGKASILMRAGALEHLVQTMWVGFEFPPLL